MANKVLFYDGLRHFWAKLKAYFVKKEEGKGLSANDLTNELKSNYDAAYPHSQAKHAPADAEKNVKSDWSETDTESAAYIKNKPVIPEKVTVDSALSDESTNPVQNKVIKEALDGKADTGHTHEIGNVNGLNDALAGKAPSSHTHEISGVNGLQDALDGKIASSAKGQAGGVATLGDDGKVPSSQLPSFVDDVIEGYLSNGVFYSNAEHSAQITGEKGKIYVDLESEGGNKTYRWSGSTYIEISSTDMVAISNEEIDQACV